MYTTVIDGEDYAVKPMNCPGGMLVYKQDMHSYRDLPMRVAEIGLVHRHEKSGALHGLMRVRCFNQDDAHIFMTEEQIKDEISGVISLIDGVYKLFGFKYHIELSTRPEDSMGSDEAWEIATAGLQNALDENGIEYTINEAMVHSTALRLTSIWRTPSAEHGSAVPSSWICRCPNALNWNTQQQTAQRNALL